MSAPNHTMTDARIMIFKLFKGFSKYYTEKNYFMYNSISIALADVMLTNDHIRESLNIEIYLKLQNCSKSNQY